MDLSASPTWLWAIIGSGTIALVARRANSLSTSGALAATLIGAVALRASWGWGLLLIIWFVLSSAVSHLGKQRKRVRTESIVAKDGQRDLAQVLANGGVFVLAATGVAFRWYEDAGIVNVGIMGTAALAAAAADTWGTEFGTLVGGEPWSLRTRHRVPAGTSGAISFAGTIALVAGALITTLVAMAVGVVPRSMPLLVVIFVAGVAGAVVDSIVGAWLQERRWCRVCDVPTERRRHGCGAATERRGGYAMIDNDVVNVLCTAAGAVVSIVLARLT